MHDRLLSGAHAGARPPRTEVCLGGEVPGRELHLVGDPVGTCFSGVCGCVIFFQVDEVSKFNF